MGCCKGNSHYYRFLEFFFFWYGTKQPAERQPILTIGIKNLAKMWNVFFSTGCPFQGRTADLLDMNNIKIIQMNETNISLCISIEYRNIIFYSMIYVCIKTKQVFLALQSHHHVLEIKDSATSLWKMVLGRRYTCRLTGFNVGYWFLANNQPSKFYFFVKC